MITAIRRIIPTPVSAATQTVPEVKVETWTPKRPKTGRMGKVNNVRDAFNRLLSAGQKRPHSSVSNTNNTGNTIEIESSVTFYSSIFRRN